MKNHDGVALIEFALVLPFLLLLVLGCVELGRFSLIRIKTDKAAYVVADIMSQSTPSTLTWTTTGCTQTLDKSGTTETEAVAALNQIDRVMSPYNNTDKEIGIVTSVSKSSTETVIKWQVSGGGTLRTDVRSDVTQAAAQSVCCAGQIAQFTGDTRTQVSAMSAGDNLIVAEIFFRYEPILAPVLQRLGYTIAPSTFVRRVYMRTRNGDLNYIHDTYPPPTPVKPSLPASCTTPVTGGGSSCPIGVGNCGQSGCLFNGLQYSWTCDAGSSVCYQHIFSNPAACP